MPDPVTKDMPIKFSLVAAGAPFLLFLATQVPTAEIVKWIVGAIL